MERRIRLTIQYDGAAYCGWQRQASGVSVQGTLEDCLRRLTGEKAPVIAAGRTDAGVHALEQVAAFTTQSVLDPAVMRRALNALLPPDIRVLEAGEVHQEFHPRRDALRKRYSYLIAVMPVLPVFIRNYVWWLKEPLDLGSIKSGAGFLLGSHDFSSFRGAGCGAKSPAREIYLISPESFTEISFLSLLLRGEFIKISLEGDSFLRHMVRNIVGTLVEVGKGKIMPEGVRSILEARDRRVAGPTAPAQGLYLEKVLYIK